MRTRSWWPWYLLGQVVVIVVLLVVVRGWLLAVLLVGVVGQLLAVWQGFVARRLREQRRTQRHPD